MTAPEDPLGRSQTVAGHKAQLAGFGIREGVDVEAVQPCLHRRAASVRLRLSHVVEFNRLRHPVPFMPSQVAATHLARLL